MGSPISTTSRTGRRSTPAVNNLGGPAATSRHGVPLGDVGVDAAEAFMLAVADGQHTETADIARELRKLFLANAGGDTPLAECRHR